MPEGRTRGQTTAQTSDAGGVAQQPHFCTSEYPSTLSVRRRRRRDQSSLPVHGFPLALARVSPAVKHGAPPPEALLCVDAEEVQWVRGVAQQLLLPMYAHFPPHLQCKLPTKIRNTHLRILRREK